MPTEASVSSPGGGGGPKGRRGQPGWSVAPSRLRRTPPSGGRNVGLPASPYSPLLSGPGTSFTGVRGHPLQLQRSWRCGMPWRECDRVSERLEFVGLAGSGAVSFSELCHRFGVSRQTGYQWLAAVCSGVPRTAVPPGRCVRTSSSSVVWGCYPAECGRHAVSPSDLAVTPTTTSAAATVR